MSPTSDNRATDTALENGMTASLTDYINCEACTCHATCTCDQESDRLVGFLALLAWMGRQPNLLGPA